MSDLKTLRKQLQQATDEYQKAHRTGGDTGHWGGQMTAIQRKIQELYDPRKKACDILNRRK